MINFENTVDLTNKNLQLSDIKIHGKNKIRLSEDAIRKLKLSEETNLVIQKTGDTFIIGTIDAASGGRKLGKDNGFSHQALANILGGKDSEWAMVGEGQPHPASGRLFYVLEQTVDPSSIEEAPQQQEVKKTETSISVGMND